MPIYTRILAILVICVSVHIDSYAQPQSRSEKQRHIEKKSYDAGSQMSLDVTVQDKLGVTHSLIQLIEAADKDVNMVVLFGGGGMGHQRAAKSGGLWCPDSFEDMHIVRSVTNYFESDVAIFPVAIPPVYHTDKLGFSKRVFLDPEPNNKEYKQALDVFIQSTETVFNGGIIPVQPFYDVDFNFMISDDQINQRAASAGNNEPWHGAFRSITETQHYGVPSIWLVDGSGKVLAEPFRGNVYHPHGGKIDIRYNLNDVVEAIEDLL